LALNNIVANPSYAAIAASLYVNAMIFRAMQVSAAVLTNPPGAFRPINGVRNIGALAPDRHGVAEDWRNGAALLR
jgi:hypothetical protein